MHAFLNRLLLFTTILLVVLMASASFYRFITLEDYLVHYEGACDPYTETCFETCLDDACTDVLYHTYVERHAAYLGALCGEDVTSCDAANTCQEHETQCTVWYCDQSADPALCEDLSLSDWKSEGSITSPSGASNDQSAI